MKRAPIELRHVIGVWILRGRQRDLEGKHSLSLEAAIGAEQTMKSSGEQARGDGQYECKRHLSNQKSVTEGGRELVSGYSNSGFERVCEILPDRADGRRKTKQ